MDANRKAARLSAIAGFREESRRLSDMGLLSIANEQRRAIERYHDEVLADLEGGDAASAHYGMRIAGTLGALLPFALLLALLDRLWAGLPVAAQIVLLIAVPAILLLLSEWLPLLRSGRYAANLAAGLSWLSLLASLLILDETFGIGLALPAALLSGLYGVALSVRRNCGPLALLSLFMSGIALFALLATLDGRVAIAASRRLDVALAVGVVFFLLSLPGRMPDILRGALRFSGCLIAGPALIGLGHEDRSLFAGASDIYRILAPVVFTLLMLAGPKLGWPRSGRLAAGLLALYLLDLLNGLAGRSLPLEAQILAGIALIPLLFWLLRLYGRYERRMAAGEMR